MGMPLPDHTCVQVTTCRSSSLRTDALVGLQGFAPALPEIIHGTSTWSSDGIASNTSDSLKNVES